MKTSRDWEKMIKAEMGEGVEVIVAIGKKGKLDTSFSCSLNTILTLIKELGKAFSGDTHAQN